MADKSYMRSAVSVGGTPSYMGTAAPASVDADPQVVAHAASDMASPEAAKAIAIARETGTTPGYVAEDMVTAGQEREKRQFAEDLRGRPALTTWAAQSPQHAAAVRKDAGTLGNLEGWFSDMGEAFKYGVLDFMHAEAMREYMGGGGPLAEHATSFEAAAEEYDKKKSSYPEHIARAVPQMFMYGVASRYGGMLGLGGLLYTQNKGVLARQIQLTQANQAYERDKEWLNQPEVQVVRKDGTVTWAKMGPEAPPDQLTNEEIDKFASAGSAVSAITLAGLLGPLVRSIPGAKSAAQQTAASILSRAAMTTIGQAAIRGLSAYGKHTLMGALGMTMQAAVNAETVRRAAQKDADIEQIARETGDTFLKVLPIAATFAAFGPGKEFLEDRARIHGSVVEQAKMNDMVKWAQQSELVKHSPNLAASLFGEMGRGAMAYINYKAAAKLKGISPEKLAQAEVEQGDVAVPLADYLAHMSDQHEAIKDDVKLTPNGYTMNEARFREKEMRQALTPKEARALYGRLTADELQKLDMPLAADMSPGFARNLELSTGSADAVKTASLRAAETPKKMTVGEPGRKPGDTLDLRVPATDTAVVLPEGASAEKNAKGDTQVTPPLHEVMAKEYGGRAQDWAEKLTPELLQALSEEGTVGAISPAEHAARVVEALPIDHLDPSPFKLQAKRAAKYIQDAAEKGVTGMAAGGFGINSGTAPQLVRDVAILHTYELARDVGLAKAKRAMEVAVEMEGLKKSIAEKAVNQDLRQKLAKAAQPVLHLFDALTEGTSVSPVRQGWLSAHDLAVEQGLARLSPEATSYADARMANALAEAKEWFKSAARPFEFADVEIQDFLSKPRPWGELRPAEARNIGDAIKQLVKVAREETIARRKDGEATVREVADEIRGELGLNPSKGLPKMSGIPTTWVEDRMLDLNAANAVQLRPKNNLRQKSEAAVKWIFDPINEAVYTRDDLMRDVGEKFKTVFEALPKELAARQYEVYNLADKLPTPGMEPMTAVPRKWLWKLAQHRMSQGNMDRIVSTTGWSKAVLDGLLFDDPRTKLTVGEWDHLQALADVKEQHMWPRIRDHFEKHYGIAPAKVAGVPFKVRLEDGTFKDYAGGYEPLKRDPRTPAAEPSEGIAQYWGKDFQAPSTPSSVKERLDSPKYLVNMDWDAGRAVIAQTLHWLAFDQPVRSVGRLLNDKVLFADMVEFMGERRAGMVKDWLKTAASRQTQSLPEGMKVVGDVFGWQRKLQVMQIVGASARLGLAQVMDPIQLMVGNQVNPLHGIPAALAVLKPLELADGSVRLFPGWNDAILHSKEVQHRADNAYQQLRNTWEAAGRTSAPTPLGRLKELAVRTAGVYLHAMDRLNSTWSWTAFHNEAVAKGMEPYSEAAKDYANGKVQDVSPVHDIETAAPILTNQQVGGFLIMHGYRNTQYNMRQDIIAKAVRDFHLAETPAQYGKASADAAVKVGLQMAMFAFGAIATKALMGNGQQKEETKGQWLMRDALAGQVDDIPFLSGLAEPLSKLAVGGKVTKRDFTARGSPGLAAFIKLQELAGQLVSEGREDYKKAFDVLETALFFTGGPSRPLRVGFENMFKLITGEGYDDAEASAGDKAGRFLYTEPQWESIKRSLTPDED